MNKLVLSKRAFWDVDMDKIDYEKNARFVIEKTINNGSWEDFSAIKNFYGDETIKQEILLSKELGPKEINFCCVVFKLRPEDFKYPVNRPAYSSLWDYSGA